MCIEYLCTRNLSPTLNLRTFPGEGCYTANRNSLIPLSLSNSLSPAHVSSSWVPPKRLHSLCQRSRCRVHAGSRPRSLTLKCCRRNTRQTFWACECIKWDANEFRPNGWEERGNERTTQARHGRRGFCQWILIRVIRSIACCCLQVHPFGGMVPFRTHLSSVNALATRSHYYQPHRTACETN